VIWCSFLILEPSQGLPVPVRSVRLSRLTERLQLVRESMRLSLKECRRESAIPYCIASRRWIPLRTTRHVHHYSFATPFLEDRHDASRHHRHRGHHQLLLEGGQLPLYARIITTLMYGKGICDVLFESGYSRVMTMCLAETASIYVAAICPSFYLLHIPIRRHQ
jgi:hypothetical protein